MLAYKYLASGAYGVLSGFRWPVGEWVEVEPPLVPSARGIHGCRVEHLAYWVDQELWSVELAGELLEGEQAVVAERGRLLERVPGWDAATRRAFTDACAARVRDAGFSEDVAERLRRPDPEAEIGYYAAYAAGHAGESSGGSYAEAFAAERSWQSRWLVLRLGLG